MPKRKIKLSQKKYPKKSRRNSKIRKRIKHKIENKENYNNKEEIFNSDSQEDKSIFKLKESHNINKVCNLSEFNKIFLENDNYKDNIIRRKEFESFVKIII